MYIRAIPLCHLEYFSVISNTITELSLKLVLTFDQMYLFPNDSKAGNSMPIIIIPIIDTKPLKMFATIANTTCNRCKKKKRGHG